MSSSRKVCPVCGLAYYDAPALSRKDSKTLICPSCGVAEALEEYEAHNSSIKKTSNKNE